MEIEQIVLFFGLAFIMFLFSAFRMFKRVKGKLDEAGVSFTEVAAQAAHQAKQKRR
jgi:hypothetical protein